MSSTLHRSCAGSILPIFQAFNNLKYHEAWISTYDKGNLLIIDVDNIDFVNNPEDLGTIINRIDAEINGLF